MNLFFKFDFHLESFTLVTTDVFYGITGAIWNIQFSKQFFKEVLEFITFLFYLILLVN